MPADVPPADSSTAVATPPPTSSVDRYFAITARGSNLSREVRGGLVTFFSMAYIIALNPLIIGTATDAQGLLISGLTPTPENQATTIGMVAAATALVAGVMTILMGVVGRYPVAIATGLGLNALLAYVIAPPTMTWPPQAMGLVVWEGIIILVLVLTGFRTAVFRAVPRPCGRRSRSVSACSSRWSGSSTAGSSASPRAPPPWNWASGAR